MTSIGTRGLPIAAALALAGLFAWLVFRHVEIRTDMADLLPAGETQASRLMITEVQSGTASSVILIGIDRAPAAELARISVAMAEKLESSGLFSGVNNGHAGFSDADRDFLFERRYLLSPATVAAAFTVPALRKDLEDLLAGLESSASPLVAKFGLADPPGVFLAMLQDWIGGSRVRLHDGVWFAADQDRALLVVQTRATGMDISAQDRVAATLAATFASTNPGGAQLLLSGPAIFAHDAAHAMRGDVETLSIFSSVLVAALLLWRFRSPWVIAAIGVPVVLSIAAAVLAVQLAFGFVHGIALGFGMTMLGVTVDYPVLLIGHRKRNEPASGTLMRIGPTLLLAVVTAALGLTGMIFSGFAGLAQLGVFAAVGVVVAAIATRWLLPWLIVAADLAPVFAGDPARLLRIEALRRFSILSLLPVIVATVGLVAMAGPRWEQDFSRLSPVPEAALRLDAELRGQIGVPGAGQIIFLDADSEEAVLQHEERLKPAFDRLVAQGVMTGIESAARFIPSVAVQLARRDVLPDAPTLAARIAEARAGMPFRETAFSTFTATVEKTRAMTPVVPTDFAGTTIGARIKPLLQARGGRWSGILVPTGLHDPAALAAALAAEPDAAYIDMRAETNRLVAGYTGRAWRWLGLGGLAALLALWIGLRDLSRLMKVVAALAASCLVTIAGLTALGTRLSLIHIVSLQLVVGIGLDYALFFARRQLDEEERARTLRTLITCNATTLLTFGLLALCATPLLREIGTTVVLGAVSAMYFSFFLVGPVPIRRPCPVAP